VPHDPLFDDAWAKWAQGVKHAHALEDDIDAFGRNRGRDPVLSAQAKYDAKRHGFAVTVTEIEPVPPLWPLMLGDVASNFRAALDHLAWALVTRGSKRPGTGALTPYAEGSVYFPIYEDRLKYNANLRRKLPGVRRADLARVRRHQPYHHGARSRALHALVMLNDINTGDKHRSLQPIWIDPATIRIHVSDERDCIIHGLGPERWRKKPLEIDTELAYLRARKTGPKPQAKVDISVTAEPSVGKRVTLQEWGTHTAAFLIVVLTEFSDPPQELIESLIDVRRLATTARALEARERER
jgi:hypothetical protein